MSFLSRIGLSVLDKATGNVLDKIGNAIKDGDIKEFTKLLSGLLEGVEDNLGNIAEKFEDVMENAEKDARRQGGRLKRQLVREMRQEMEQVGEEFAEKLIEAMRPQIAELVKAEVALQLAANQPVSVLLEETQSSGE